MFDKNYKIAFLFLTLDNINWPQFWNNYIIKNKDYLNIYVHPKNPEKITISWLGYNTILNCGINECIYLFPEQKNFLLYHHVSMKLCENFPSFRVPMRKG